ncbi:MAG: ABC transporter ATP-binding protein, partial [Planctomycetota bacterium]
ASTALPADLAVPGLLRAEVDGRRALLTVDGVTPALLADLRQRLQTNVLVDDLNLEEIFLELHSGTAAHPHTAR